MKSVFLSPIKLTRPCLLSFFLLTSLLLSLTVVWQTGQAQQAQLSLADILIALRSKKVTLAERNKLLTDAVKTRGITFALTPEIESELGNTGANSELIEAIRQRNVKLKAASIPKPTSAATPKSVATPTPVPSPPAPDFAFYRKRADENVVKGKYDLAVDDYNQALKLNPKDILAYLYRGQAYSGKKDFDSAIADYNKVIELNPKEAMAYLKRGDSYEKKGDSQKAIGDYQKVVELDVGNESAKNNLKRLQIEQAKISQAERAKTLPEPKKQEAPLAVEPPKVPQIVELGQLNGLAVKMVSPEYPPIAKKMNVQGTVTVQISLDEEGKVISAKATAGNSLLRSTCETAVRKTKFKPARVGNQAVKANGFITYNFTNKM